jgi:hypothetical protein
MKLREWAHANHVHPKTTYRWSRQGTLPLPAREVSARTILVEQPRPVVWPPVGAEPVVEGVAVRATGCRTGRWHSRPR